MKPNLVALAFVSLAGLAACNDSAPTTPSVPLARPATSVSALRLPASVNADRELMRTVVHDAVQDGLRNSDQWFGDKQHRNRFTVCEGVQRLLAKHMAKYDEAKHRSRGSADRRAEAVEITSALGCNSPAPMSLFGRPMALSATTATTETAAPDDFDDWWAVNWDEASWTASAMQYAENEGGDIAPYIVGMNDLQVSVFQSLQCGQEEAVAEIAELEEGEYNPMMLFYAPKWLKAALIGCASNVVVNIPDLVTGARLGFALGGPGGAAAATAAVAAEHCIYGAIAGYMVWKVS